MLFDYYTGVKMEPSHLWVDMIYSIVEFKMRVLEESLGVFLSTINTFDFVQKGQSFVCVGRTVE